MWLMIKERESEEDMEKSGGVRKCEGWLEKG